MAVHRVPVKQQYSQFLTVVRYGRSRGRVGHGGRRPVAGVRRVTTEVGGESRRGRIGTRHYPVVHLCQQTVGVESCSPSRYRCSCGIMCAKQGNGTAGFFIFVVLVDQTPTHQTTQLIHVHAGADPVDYMQCVYQAGWAGRCPQYSYPDPYTP